MYNRRLGKPLRNPITELGWRFYNLRRAQALDRNAAADSFGLTWKTYSEFEHGSRTPPQAIIMLLQIFEREQSGDHVHNQRHTVSHRDLDSGRIRV